MYTFNNDNKPESENVTRTYFFGKNLEPLVSFTIFSIALLIIEMSAAAVGLATSMTNVRDDFSISSLERIPNISRKTSEPISLRSPLAKLKKLIIEIHSTLQYKSCNNMIFKNILCECMLDVHLLKIFSLCEHYINSSCLGGGG